MSRLPSLTDIIGQTFGHWTVIGAGTKSMAICRCACGKEKPVSKHNLLNGKTSSCGCKAKTGPTTHGMSKHPLYQLWKGMKARCYNQNHKNYTDYGGRGIEICPEWKNDFAQFVKDVGERPSKKHSLDREDTNGNYEPDNCRWATQKEQTRNTRKSVTITLKGKTRTVAEWSEITGILDATIYYRVSAGWPPEKALSKPRPLAR